MVTLHERRVAYLGGGLVGAWEEDGDAHTFGAVCPLVVRASTRTERMKVNYSN